MKKFRMNGQPGARHTQAVAVIMENEMYVSFVLLRFQYVDISEE